MTALRFTTHFVDWAGWVPPLDPDTASPEQQRVIGKSAMRSNQYTRVCAHDPDSFRIRSQLNHAIIHSEGGLAQSERELAAFVESRLNGCPYCVSHHSREFVALTGEEELALGILAEGPEAAQADPKRGALIRFAIRATPAEPAFDTGDVEALRAAGHDDLAILDAIHVTGMFAWGNRLLQSLGEPVYKD